MYIPQQLAVMIGSGMLLPCFEERRLGFFDVFIVVSRRCTMRALDVPMPTPSLAPDAVERPAPDAGAVRRHAASPSVRLRFVPILHRSAARDPLRLGWLRLAPLPSAGR